mgnify:CR=1 FL=1
MELSGAGERVMGDRDDEAFDAKTERNGERVTMSVGEVTLA